MYITETKQTPVLANYDVAVCGGFAGISAALAAARCGKRVILLERQFLLGGLGTAGLISIYLPLCDGCGRQVPFGIAEELFRLSILHGAEAMLPENRLCDNGSRTQKDPRFEVRYNPQVFAMLAEQLLCEAGVDILYGTYVVDVEVDGGKIRHVVVENKSGRRRSPSRNRSTHHEKGGKVMYKTETHLHVSEVSGCSQLSAQDMMGRYHAAGYDTVFVSDHLTYRYFSRLGELPWHEKTAAFLSGYEKAKEAGEALGMTVLLAAELSLNSLPNDYLLYGIDKSFLDAREDLFDLSVAELHAHAQRHSVTVVQAHPYRDGVCVPTPEHVDALEAYNSNPRHENHTEQMLALAVAHGLPVTAGSDAHRPEDVAKTGILTKQKIQSADDYVRAIKSGEFRVIGKEDTV